MDTKSMAKPVRNELARFVDYVLAQMKTLKPAERIRLQDDDKAFNAQVLEWADSYKQQMAAGIKQQKAGSINKEAASG